LGSARGEAATSRRVTGRTVGTVDVAMCAACADAHDEKIVDADVEAP
jgi:hypothetical protein